MTLKRLALILIMLASLAHASFTHISTDFQGMPFRYGAGIQQPPLLDNGGNVIFTAPMPQHENSDMLKYTALYQATAGNITQLHAGVDDLSVILGHPLRTTCHNVAASPDLNTMAVIVEERMSSANPYTRTLLKIICDKTVTDMLEIGESPQITADNCQIQLAQDTILVQSEQLEPMIFRLQDGTLEAGPAIDQELFQNMTELILTPDGTAIILAAYLPDHNLATGQSGIFKYDLKNQKLDFIAPAGRTTLKTDLTISGDGKTIAFRRLSNTIAVVSQTAQGWSEPSWHTQQEDTLDTPALSQDGRFLVFHCQRQGQQVIACLDRQTELLSILPTPVPGAACFQPAISPDGSTIAFLAQTPEDTPQVYTCPNSTLSAQTKETFTISKGWNLIAMPFQPDAATMIRLKKLGPAFTFLNNRYELLDDKTLAPGQGCWLYSDHTASLELTGSKRTPKPLHQGWNLIAPQAYPETELPGHSFMLQGQNMVRLMNLADVKLGQAIWFWMHP